MRSIDYRLFWANTPNTFKVIVQKRSHNLSMQSPKSSQKLRYHQDCRISPIWPQKWIPHPQKPYRRHPYVYICSNGSKVINLQDVMSKILNKQEYIIFQLCLFLNKHCLDPDIIFWWSIGWSPGGPKFSRVSETPIYGCPQYGFQGWGIHF